MSQIQEIGKYVEEATTVVKKVEPCNVCVSLQHNDVIEASIFTGKKIDENEAIELQTKLVAMFPDMNQVAISELVNTIVDDGWSSSRVDYAFRQIKDLPYKTFPIGKFLQCDKKITFGRSEIALRRKLRFEITQRDIVVVKLERKYGDNGEKDWFRAYAYKEEAEDIMPQRIIGRWNDGNNCFEFTEIFFDHTIEQRQSDFKRSLYKFCNVPPNYNGKYPASVVQQFYDKYSRVVPPGDYLLYETKQGFNAETWLEAWYIKVQQQNQN